MAIDQGTTGTRVALFDRQGRLKVKAYREFQQYYPKPGWVEHDPLEILRVTLRVCRAALDAARVSAGQIEGIGITNQRETSVLWDKRSGRPVHNAIVWQDRRTAPLCDELRRKGLEPKIRQKTGLVLDPYFSGSKIKWLLDQAGSLRQKAAKGDILFGTIDSWLLWNLTGGRSHATDHTNASRTLLLHLEKKKWDPELLKLFGVPEGMLPQVKSSASDFGRTVRIAPLVAGIPIFSLVGDQQAALFGQGCYSAGDMKNTYGTGCFLVLNTGKNRIRSQHGLLTTLCCDRLGQSAFALEGSIFIAGAVIQWLRDELRFLAKASESEKIARSLKDTGGVTVIPAFVGLGAPYWDAQARGAILGITRGTGPREIVKAALESIAYQTCDVFDAMRKDSGLSVRRLKVDGGATENRYLMQRQADLLGIEVLRTRLAESTVWGAAKLAGLASGVWDLKKVDGLMHYDSFVPKMRSKVRKALLAGWREKVSRILSRLKEPA